jgi:hypothetical protein
MPDLAAKSATKSAKNTNNQSKPRKCADAQTALDLRYGEIGISAVAAAARYQSGARNSGSSAGGRRIGRTRRCDCLIGQRSLRA